VQQRKWPSGIVEIRTADDLEAEAFVESARGIVLLVHVDRQCSAPQRLHMRNQAPTTTAPVHLGVEKKRLDLVVRDSDEAERSVVRIYQDPKIHRVALQLLRNEWTELLDVGAREEVMRRSHSALPDLHQPR